MDLQSIRKEILKNKRKWEARIIGCKTKEEYNQVIESKARNMDEFDEIRGAGFTTRKELRDHRKSQKKVDKRRNK